MRSYNRLDVDRLHETATEKTLRAEIAAVGQAGPAPDQSTGRCRGSPASTTGSGRSSRSRR